MGRRNRGWDEGPIDRTGERTTGRAGDKVRASISEVETDLLREPDRDQVVRLGGVRGGVRRPSVYEERLLREAARTGDIVEDRLDGSLVYPEPPRRVRVIDRARRLGERLSPLMIPFLLLAWLRASTILADWSVAGDWSLDAFLLAAARIAAAGALCLVPVGLLFWRRDAPTRAPLLFLGAVLWTTLPAIADFAWWLITRAPAIEEGFGYPTATFIGIAVGSSTLGLLLMGAGLQRARQRRDEWFGWAIGRGSIIAVMFSLFCVGRLVAHFQPPADPFGQAPATSPSGLSLLPSDVVATVVGVAAPFELLGFALIGATALAAWSREEPQRRLWQLLTAAGAMLAAVATVELPGRLLLAGTSLPEDQTVSGAGTYTIGAATQVVTGIVASAAGLPAGTSWGAVLITALMAAGAIVMVIGLGSPVWSSDPDAEGMRPGAPEEIFVWGPTARTLGMEPIAMQRVVAVAAGADHSLAVDASGRVAAWGDNTVGQLNVPPDLDHVVAVSAGDGFSLALKADGTVAAWGANYAGQSTPPADLRDVKAVAAGGAYGLALRADGTVVAWGEATDALLAVPEGLVGVTAISAGRKHALALRADGRVAAWGDDSFGQLAVPLKARPVTAIAAGGNFSVAMRADGTLVAWGDGSYGQLDVPESLTNVTAIAAGAFHALALTASGDILGWGGGGQAKGEFTHPWRLVDFRAVAAGEGFSLAVKAA